jgi:hypothetical protein
MELFSHIDASTAKDCYANARIRKVFMDEWKNLVRISDQHENLRVKNTRPEDPSVADNNQAESSHQEPSADTNESSSRFSLGHEHILHTSLTAVGQYVLSPSKCYHRGYYNTDTKVKKTFVTAQLFAIFRSSNSSH